MHKGGLPGQSSQMFSFTMTLTFFDALIWHNRTTQLGLCALLSNCDEKCLSTKREERCAVLQYI